MANYVRLFVFDRGMSITYAGKEVKTPTEIVLHNIQDMFTILSKYPIKDFMIKSEYYLVRTSGSPKKKKSNVHREIKEIKEKIDKLTQIVKKKDTITVQDPPKIIHEIREEEDEVDFIPDINIDGLTYKSKD